MNFYNFVYKDITGRDVKFEEFKGKIVLIVNTALHDTFSNQYKDLERTYQIFKKYDFEILDFPCNQFHGMVPEGDEEITEFLNKEYNPTFIRFPKCEVKGNNKIDLYSFLIKKKKFNGLDITHPMSKVINSINIKEGIISNKNSEVRWNFTKFLVDRYGNVVKRFEVTNDYDNVNKAIRNLINTQPQLIFDELTGIIKENLK